MIEPAGIILRLDRADPRAPHKPGGCKADQARLSAIPLARFIDQHEPRCEPNEDRYPWPEFGWNHDSPDTISRRIYRLHHEPWVTLANVEDWLTYGPYSLRDVYPEAARELDEETLS